MRLNLQKRSRQPWWFGSLVVLAGVLVALLFVGLLFLWVGVNPWQAYLEILRGAFGSADNFSEVLVRATPILLCGLAVGLAGRMLIWNIGAEGQLVLGAVAGSAVGLFASPHLPGILVLPAMLLAAFAGGGLWGLVPGLLKARLKVNEIITSLMLNYVAILWLEHLYFGPWRDPAGRGFPGTALFPKVACLPRFWGTRIHLGFFVALAAMVVIWFLLNRTRWGFEIRAVGAGPEAARYAGIPINRHIIWVMLISGGLAGLAGIGEAAGIHLRLQQGLAAGNGYVGIIAAWLARLNPFWIGVIALLLGALAVGGDQLQIVTQVPSAISLVLEGAILFCVLAAQVIKDYRLVIKRGPRP